MIKISQIRNEYTQSALDEQDLTVNPMDLFNKWLQEYINLPGVIEPTAFVLATVDAAQQPLQRVLLLKEINAASLGFYSNYHSNKGVQLAHQPKASMHFFWPQMQRQISLSGRVSKMPAAKSDEYFQSRPKGSQIGALASQQSQPLANRALLEAKVQQLEQQYADVDVLTRPEHWGGYELHPERIEFWQGRSNRLHDRFVYQLLAEKWQWQRLNP